MKRKSLFFSAVSSISLALIALVLTGCPQPNEPPAPDFTAPANLTSVTTEVTETSVTFTWENPSDKDYDHMDIYSAVDYTKIAEVEKSKTTYTVTNLTPGTDYVYSFVSVDALGNASTGYECKVKTKVLVNKEIGVPTDLKVKQKPSSNGISVSLTWTEPNSDNINYYDINVKKGSNLYTSSKAVRNSFDIALEEGEYTIEVIAVLNDYSQTEPGSITFTVSQEIAEQSVLKGLTLTIDAEGLEGKGTEEEPYIIYRDNTDYYITDYDKEIKFSIAPDPETAEITGKIYYDHSSGLKYDAEKKLITGFSTSYDATLAAYTLDDSYNTIYSNKVYFRVGFAFDSVSLEQDDFNLALDSEVQKTLTPQYYKGDVELPVTPLIKAKSWTSSDETVAVVENGVVKALSAGKATITYTADGHSATVNVTVYDSYIYPTSVKFKTTEKLLKVGTEYALEPVIEPENYNMPVTFYAFKAPYVSNTVIDESLYSDVVSINGTTVKAEKEGDAYIYASWTKVESTFYSQKTTTYISGNYLTLKARPETTSFTLTDSDVELAFDETYQIRTILTPENSIYFDDEISYKSSNPKVLVSETGLVSCDENETEVQESEITVKILDVEQTLKVKFCIPVTSVKLDKNLIILGKNSETSTFTATVYPENASDKTVTWECSDTDVISLENGTITTKAAGVATITAKAGEKQATASILVLNTSDSFTYDRSTLHQLTAEEAGNYAGYYTDAAGKIAYAYTTAAHADSEKYPRDCGKWDIVGKKGDKWLSSTYHNAGWGYKINDRVVSLNQAGTASNGNVSLTVKPILVYNKGVPFVMFVNALTNTGNVDLTGVKFGSGTDVQIAGNDSAPVNASSVGANLVDPKTEMIFALNCLSGEAVTPVDTLWIGRYNDCAMDNVYTDKRTSVTNTDSAIAYSWQNIDLKAGETKVFTVRLTFVEDEGGTLEALVY